MKCPLCDVTLLVSSREGIEIDHCPQCRGVWLDRGELDKIIERAAPAVVGASGAPPRDRGDEPSRYGDERYQGDRYDRDHRDDDRRGDPRRRKRRGGFLEDLFDFD